MLVSYRVCDGLASKKSGRDCHAVLFKDIGKELKNSSVREQIVTQCKEIRNAQAKIITLWLAVWVTLTLVVTVIGYKSGFPIDRAVIDSILIVGLPVVMVAKHKLSTIKSKVDRASVAIFLSENNEVIQKLFRDFIASIDREAQPLLAGCDNKTFRHIDTIYDLECENSSKNSFDIVGYCNMADHTIKVIITVGFFKDYKAAFVTEYTISKSQT